jgi:hypothetical protein
LLNAVWKSASRSSGRSGQLSLQASYELLGDALPSPKRYIIGDGFLFFPEFLRRELYAKFIATT